MPPMKLVCRGSDPRAMKGFVAASLSGREVAFEPMLKGAEGHGGSPIQRKPGFSPKPLETRNACND